MLQLIAAGVAAWCIASVPAALLVGRFMRAGAGPDPTTGSRIDGDDPEPPEGAMVPAVPPRPAPAPVAAAA